MTDKVKFYAAARKLLDHRRAKGRANGVRLIARMPAEDLHFVADKVVHIAENKDLAYHSCHNMDPISGVISLMARLNIKGGIEHAFDVLDSEGGKGTFKIKMLLDILPKYGANAKEALPRIKATKAGKFQKEWDVMTREIENSDGQREMITLEKLINANKIGEPERP